MHGSSSTDTQETLEPGETGVGVLKPNTRGMGRAAPGVGWGMPSAWGCHGLLAVGTWAPPPQGITTPTAPRTSLSHCQPGHHHHPVSTLTSLSQ